MGLKLWEKSFLLTFIIFFALLNVCLVMWCLFNINNNYKDFTDGCMQEADSIIFLEKHISEGTINEAELEQIAAMHEEKKTYIRLSVAENVLVDNLPVDCQEDYYTGRLKAEGPDYYYIDLRYSDCRLVYMKSMEGAYKQFRHMVLWMLLIDIVLAVIVGALLYIAMRKIYKPVSNISHELRTPLTSILGYAQYLSMEGVPDADKTIAVKRIESDARYMRNIVERLLTVESLTGNNIEKVKLDFDRIITELKEIYPSVSFDNKLQTIEGEEALVKILLTNLIENAVREDPEPVFIAQESTITIINKVDQLTEGDVVLMNSGKRLSDERIKGHGIGLELCQDIAKSHGWQIKYKLTGELLDTSIVIKGINGKY